MCLLVVMLVGALPSFANQAVSINISDLMKADVAFTGTCVSAETSAMTLEGKPGKILVTRYTFDVSESLKGDVPKTFSFLQWGATRADAAKVGLPFVYGPPLYRIGSEYTLFLGSVSRLGLRAPVGLGQGKFLVVREPGGKAMVVNETGNKSLFSNLPQTKAMTKALSAGGIKGGTTAPAGPMDYSNFRDVIKSLSERE
jgi:hypothetical protein